MTKKITDYTVTDKLTGMDDDWPHDPNVPELPSHRLPSKEKQRGSSLATRPTASHRSRTEPTTSMSIGMRTAPLKASRPPSCEASHGVGEVGCEEASAVTCPATPRATHPLRPHAPKRRTCNPFGGVLFFLSFEPGQDGCAPHGALERQENETQMLRAYSVERETRSPSVTPSG
jgi:hypothetical protein